MTEENTSPESQQTEQTADQATESEQQAPSSVEVQLAERTADLQRLQAEYLNYKRRVDRDREMVRTNATASILSSLMPVLDDIGLARDHGQLEGGFKSVADSIQQVARTHGLEAFGEDGDTFDPMVHEALMHGFSDEVEGPTADKVLQVGYRVGDKVLRPARVSVVEPGEDPADQEPETVASEDAAADGDAPQDRPDAGEETQQD